MVPGRVARRRGGPHGTPRQHQPPRRRHLARAPTARRRPPRPAGAHARSRRCSVIEVDLKALVGRLDAAATQALHAAAGATLARTHHEVTPAHVLLELLGSDHADVHALLDRFAVPADRLRASLERTLSGLRTGNGGRPVFSPLLVEWLQDAWLVATVEAGATTLSGAALLATVVLRRARYGDQVGTALAHVPADSLRAALPELLGAPTPAADADDGDGPLARFTVDLTAQARAGTLDPIFGREAEIRRVIDVLSRRRKNNPILVGEPGVGKTAVVEGLAQAIVAGEVPEALRGVSLRTLDVALLQAGAGVRGELERRLDGVIRAVRGSLTPIILFVDEAHTLVGAQAGGTADLLKPALARGELRTIAATTWREYKTHLDKDPALTRRFEVVAVDEPTPAVAIGMLRGLAGRYARAHGVHVTDAAVVAAVELSHRYLTGRQLPDKAVSLLDTAAARVRIGQDAPPAALLDARARLADAERALAAHVADLQGASAAVPDRRPDLQADVDAARADRDAWHDRWQAERHAVGAVLDARTTDASDRAALDHAVAALDAVRDDTPLVHAEVDADAIAQVVAAWTGIPVGRMVQDELATLDTLEAQLGARIRGQDPALSVIAEGIRQARAGLHDPCRPRGVFLLVGPSGVGKTETALGLADLLYGGERSVITINLSEFQEKHTISRLVGSPPGYVGYGEGGVLTEAVRHKPYAVVLLDECEKADPEVLELFYQVFDKGTLADGEGRLVDFRNTVILLTSNLATEPLTRLLETGVPDDPETVVARIRPILSRHFQPALLARMTVVPYYPLPADVLRGVVDLKIGAVARRIQAQHGVRLTWSTALADTLAARCTEVEAGARHIDHLLRSTLLPVLSRQLLSGMVRQDLPDRLHLDVDALGQPVTRAA
ncbi:MAG: type VI secretion system ATPase TssH [Alphaproteobacteria bacterium]|nr:type VI secretion system ATPase TssH [Alphaproteobacteria bacterium]